MVSVFCLDLSVVSCIVHEGKNIFVLSLCEQGVLHMGQSYYSSPSTTKVFHAWVRTQLHMQQELDVPVSVYIREAKPNSFGL